MLLFIKTYVRYFKFISAKCPSHNLNNVYLITINKDNLMTFYFTRTVNYCKQNNLLLSKNQLRYKGIP